MITRVETYVSINSKVIEETLSSKNKSVIQGNNLLFEFEHYKKGDVRAFLEFVIDDVNKIALETGIKKYALLMCHFKEDDVEEPFKEFVDMREELGNDIDAIVEYICK